MFKLGALLFVFMATEFVAYIIFPALNKKLGPSSEQKQQASETILGMETAIFKGLLERLVIVIGLVYGYHQILIVFGGLKLGTRLHEEKETKISNTFFLIGNLMSLLLAMICAIITTSIWNS